MFSNVAQTVVLLTNVVLDAAIVLFPSSGLTRAKVVVGVKPVPVIVIVASVVC